MAKKRSTVVLLVAGAVVFAVSVFVGGLIWFFTFALERSPADEATAEVKFQEIRKRFSGTTPVFVMGEHGPTLNRQLPTTPARGQLHNVQMLGLDANDGELVHVTIPFWLIRMKPGGVNVATRDGNRSVRLSLNPDDVESYGPALLLENTDEEGYHLMIWTE